MIKAAVAGVLGLVALLVSVIVSVRDRPRPDPRPVRAAQGGPGGLRRPAAAA